MEIKTKLNPGDMAWYMNNDVIHSAPIRALQVRAAEEDFEPREIGPGKKIKDPFCKSTVGVFYFTCHGRFAESRVYSSREELGAAIAEGTYNTPANDAGGKL
ncbi:MAG: hypothetical protein JXR12_06230 [Neptunomonas phycophila]|uniref:hypothetical protein n=1 Tax=Neptunomonas phycophila TaxID=1572645 RepID=UPI003B8DE375